MAKEYDVELAYWEEGSGFTNNETIDQISEEDYENTFAEIIDYYKSEFNPDAGFNRFDDIELRVVYEDGYVVDRVWLGFSNRAE